MPGQRWAFLESLNGRRGFVSYQSLVQEVAGVMLDCVHGDGGGTGWWYPGTRGVAASTVCTEWSTRECCGVRECGQAGGGKISC